MISRFVAVEFDTHPDLDHDPADNSTHVGIDINNLRSVASQNWSEGEWLVRIKYDSVSQNLSVSVINSTDYEIELYYIIDLREVLPQWVIFGFTASTGTDGLWEKNTVISWSFNSSDLEVDEEIFPGIPPAPTQNPAKGKNRAGQFAGLIAGISVVLAFIAIFSLFIWRRKKSREKETEEVAFDIKAQERETKLLEWVWDLYGTGTLLKAADPRLGSDFEEEELKRLMIVGLWCAHPHAPSRPSMRQAIQVLNFEALVPILPSKIPMLAFYEPPTSSLYTSSSGSNTLSSNHTTASSFSSPSALLFNYN
ncbi:hypothetical protein L1987_27074 [Smallanthus sonchifolius]|uniref:Uncharacterized protein n=1 Tax=Smallanthus sonchifolius TaxID=185202 RepID=A0ACB9IAD7_9ASTR|nr:hypothetical protein L1987_27074 [Smallanthus sonchifolius]